MGSVGKQGSVGGVMMRVGAGALFHVLVARLEAVVRSYVLDVVWSSIAQDRPWIVSLYIHYALHFIFLFFTWVVR